MKILRHISLAAFLIIGFALTASAQREPEKREKPPKPRVEIKPEEKPPRNNENRNEERRNENRPRKPQGFFLISENRIEITSI